MSADTERRLLQIAVALACIVPLMAGGIGVLRSVTFLGLDAAVPVNLDSHFRYLSGLLLGIGLIFAASIPRVESAGAVFLALGAIVVIGGLARLFSLAEVGPPRGGHQYALAMELIVTPLLVLWQAHVARRHAPPRTS